MGDKIEVGVPVKGHFVGVKVPEKVVILGMKLNTKIVLVLLGIIGLGAVVYLFMSLAEMSRLEQATKQSVKESGSLQG